MTDMMHKNETSLVELFWNHIIGALNHQERLARQPGMKISDCHSSCKLLEGWLQLSFSLHAFLFRLLAAQMLTADPAEQGQSVVAVLMTSCRSTLHVRALGQTSGRT